MGDFLAIMQIVRGLSGRSSQRSVLAIGNFDGVHLGHQTLVQRVRARAQALGCRSGVLTFEPHPRQYFVGKPLPRLSSLREKMLLLADAGVDLVCVCHFNAAFAALSAAAFVDRVHTALQPAEIWVGEDFRFGHDREGDVRQLAAAGARLGFTVEAIPAVIDALAGRVSSSVLRKALQAGDLDFAHALLGRPYSMAGRVMSGRQLGRTLGFPTANIVLRQRLAPFAGVFAVRVAGLSDRLYEGVANLGVRPTLHAGAQPCLEVHVFDWQADCYGKCLRVDFMSRLREERKFDSLAQLQAQIGRDVQAARDFFARRPLADGEVI